MDAFLPDRLRSKTVLVLGLGRFSGGVETARFLQRVGARCVISDTASPESLGDGVDAARALGAELVFGPQSAGLLRGVDAVIASPAVPFDHLVLDTARERGIPVAAETSVVLGQCPAPIYGVTGTKGKSTTAALIASMLEATGRRVHFGGNIGRALIGSLDDIAPDDRVVLELSSFQLWWGRQAERSPSTTVVTNLFPDHLDRHVTMEAYAEAKRAALDFQGEADLAVLPSADAAIREAGWHTAGAARRVTYGAGGTFTRIGRRVLGPDTSLDLDGFQLVGRHNRHNALAAAAAVLATGDATPEQVQAGAAAMAPLPHRMQPVCDRGGVAYVDDSNATNPRSTLCALEAFDRPTVLLLGGKDKGLDPEPLLRGVRTHARAVVGIGTTGPELVSQLDGIETAVATDMEDAVRRAAALARPGDVVLLAPAYSSLDEYASFAVRGDRFQAAARAQSDMARPA